MSSRNRFLFVAVLAAVFVAFVALAGCGTKTATGSGSAEGQASGQTGQEQTPAQSEGGQLYTPEYQPTGSEVAVFETTKGRITVKLFGNDAPVHVGNFVELAEKGFYDKTKFHRFEPGFVIQGGDPQTKEYAAADVAAIIERQKSGQYDPNDPAFGTGGPGYTIKGEFDPSANPNKHVVGALGMARSQSPDSAGSQFYFALQPLPQLDGSYTVFGVVTEGLDVVKELRIGDEITSIEITGK